MSDKGEQICRLCLKVTKEQLGKIDELVRQILDVLLLKVDLMKASNCIVCQDCVEVAKKCLLFKYTCINTEKVVLSFSAKKNAKHNIKDIYKEKEHIRVVFNEDLYICRFCLKRLENDKFFSLDTLINETSFGIMIQYMPELDFKNIEDSTICTACRKNLEDYRMFVLRCMDAEVRIKLYCVKEGSESIDQSKLDIFDKKELEIKKEITLEENNSKNLSEVRLDQYGRIIFSKDHAKEMKSNEIFLETIEMYKCSSCAYETRKKRNLNKHKLVHKNTTRLKRYKCSSCAYEAKQKSNLNKHMLVHKEVSEIKMYKCSSCAYEARQKSNLNKHMLVHKDASEIQMYKCPSCSYEARQKSNLNKHMLTHKDISEVQMYKCSLCAYESRQKDGVQKHMLIHKDVSEIEMHKCTLCDYEAKRKYSLKVHMLVHKDFSEIKMFQCPSCSYETREKSNLKKHMLVHMDVSQIKMYKCPSCSYEARQKSNLNKHMLSHKDAA